MKKITRICLLSIFATAIFYCGTAFQAGSPDASADASLDASIPGDGGASCVTCPDPCPTCPSPVRIEVYDVVTSPDASVVIPVPDFNNGVVIQGYTRSPSSGGPFWRGNHEDCNPMVYTEPPLGYPNLPVPSVLYPEGIHRQCKVVVIRPQTEGI